MVNFNITVFMGTMIRSKAGSALEDAAAYLATVDAGKTIRAGPMAVQIGNGRYYRGYAVHDS